jgi:hypothetical protein
MTWSTYDSLAVVGVGEADTDRLVQNNEISLRVPRVRVVCRRVWSGDVARAYVF